MDSNLMLKMALNDENEMNSLLSYYRDRLHEFDNERQEWLAKLEEIRYKQDEKHKTEWELKKRKQEISEMQSSLKEAKLNLYEERQKNLKLIKENDELKIKQIEDHRKISELLSITNVVEQDVFICRNLLPSIINYIIRKKIKNKNDVHNIFIP